MSEHTEGPWQSEQAGPNTWIKAKDVTIAYIGGKDSIFTNHPGTPHKANARLIAAAPELLEACELLYEKYSILSNDDADALPAPIFNIIENETKAAIAKATD